MTGDRRVAGVTTSRLSRIAARHTWPRATASRSAASVRPRPTRSTRRRILVRSATAGALTTAGDDVADRARRLRNGGQTDRYQHGEFGVNSRLDEMQAAILRARLHFLPRWTDQRRALAAAYRSALRDSRLSRCRLNAISGHVYHLFPGAQRRARSGPGQAEGGRDRDADSLSGSRSRGSRRWRRTVRTSARSPTVFAREVFSLPLYPALPPEATLQVAAALSTLAHSS